MATLTIPPSANAITYDVSRSWSQGLGSASLIGTVDVALGSYTITNGGLSPFTSVSLMLILNGSAPILLDHADTSLISGTGQFFISATASSLIFDAAGNSANPADLQFYDTTNTAGYAIGSNGNPNFQVAFTTFGSVLGSVSFPNVFGTAASSVPDTGSTLAMLSVILLGLGIGFNRLSRAN